MVEKENDFVSGMNAVAPLPKPGFGTEPRPLMKPRAWLFGLRLPRAWTFATSEYVRDRVELRGVLEAERAVRLERDELLERALGAGRRAADVRDGGLGVRAVAPSRTSLA